MLSSLIRLSLGLTGGDFRDLKLMFTGLVPLFGTVVPSSPGNFKDVYKASRLSPFGSDLGSAWNRRRSRRLILLWTLVIASTQLVLLPVSIPKKPMATTKCISGESPEEPPFLSALTINPSQASLLGLATLLVPYIFPIQPLIAINLFESSISLIGEFEAAILLTNRLILTMTATSNDHFSAFSLFHYSDLIVKSMESLGPLLIGTLSVSKPEEHWFHVPLLLLAHSYVEQSVSFDMARDTLNFNFQPMTPSAFSAYILVMSYRVSVLYTCFGPSSGVDIYTGFRSSSSANMTFMKFQAHCPLDQSSKNGSRSISFRWGRKRSLLPSFSTEKRTLPQIVHVRSLGIEEITSENHLRVRLGSIGECYVGIISVF
ncbi:unnamed protein product [Cochlearia groenlandica]